MADPIEVDPIAEQMAQERRAREAGAAPPITSEPVDLGGDEEDDPVAAEMAREREQLEQQRAQFSRYRATKDAADPAQRAQVLKYSAAVGLDPELVERNFDLVKREVDAQGVDWSELRRRQPGLARYLDDRPEGHPLAQEDFERMGRLEWALSAPAHAFNDAANSVGLELWGALKDFYSETLGPNLGLTPTLDMAEGFPSFKGAGSISQGEIPVEQKQKALVAERGEYGAENLPAQAVLGSARALPFLAENVAVAAATGPLAPAAIFTLNYAHAQQQLKERFSDFRGADGLRVDPDTVDAAVQTGALLNGALQIAPVGKAIGLFGKGAGMLPGSKELVRRFSGDAVERILADQTAATLLKRAAGQWGVHTLNAGVMMGLQGAVNQGAEEGLKGAVGLEANLGNVAQAFADSFVQGLKDMALLSATGPGAELIASNRRLAQSRRDAARYEQLAQAAQASKMLELSPGETERAVAAMAQTPGADTQVHVPVEAWNTYWQAQKVDPGKVAEALLGDDGKAYGEASVIGGDLSIPVEKWVAKLGKTEHVLGLREDVRLNQEALTPREAKAEAKRQQAELERQAKERGAELERGKKEVHDFIRDQAVAAGEAKEVAEANAKLAAEYAGTMALRMGVSVQEAAAQGAFGRLTISGPKGEAVAAAARARFQEFLAPSASSQLAGRLDTMSPEARARELYADAGTGLLNARAFDELPAAEGKQVAVISSPTIKAINDDPAGGHDRGNELLRALGRVVGEVDPQAAKAGTNLLFRVKDQAELDAVLAKARAAIPEPVALAGGLGVDRAAALKSLNEGVDARRAAGELPARDAPVPGLDVAGLKLPEGRARSEVPGELVERVRGLSEEAYFREAYQDPKSPGILSRAGWDAIPRKRYQALLDLKGLKRLNERLGPEAGDLLLKQFGFIAEHFGGSSFDFAHLSGDEYAAQHNDAGALESWVARLSKEAQTYIYIDGVGPDGNPLRYQGAEFRHGIGKGLESADRDLNAKKRAEGSGEAPRDPGRVQGDGDRDRRDGDLAGGREALGRGATPQGYPGAGEGRLRQAAVEDASFDFGANVAHLEGGAVEFRPSGLAAARAAIARMRPENREAAQAFFDYAIGQREDRPAITPELERRLAEHGVVDPRGYTFDESGREMARALGGPKKLSAEPASLREYRLRRRGMYKAYGDADAPVDVKLEQPPGEGDEGRPSPRGSIEFRIDPAGRPVEFRIEAFKGDRSTLAHETAHFLSWSLHEIATSDLASPDIRADYDALLKWAGYESAEQRVRERDAAREEKFSHAWEQYLAEGKAPSAKLARVFSRFKEWMLRIYRGLSGIGAQYQAQHGQPLELSDEVRGVFDRMLAADESLTTARAEVRIPERPDPDVERGMSPEEREVYRRALVDARTAAEAEVGQRAAEFQGDEVRAARARIAGEVAAELDGQPRYRLWRLLELGEVPDGKGGALAGADVPEVFRDGAEPLRLNRELVAKKYGPEVARKLAPLFRGKRKGGADPDALAALFNFGSGDELVAELFNAVPREEAVAQRTQERMQAEYGPVLKRIQEAAMSAVHSDAQARTTLLELRALAAQVDPAAARRARSISLEALKDTARRIVEGTPVGEVDPARFARAERATALRAERLWGAGKKAEALEEREARLLNQVLYREARDRAEALEKARKTLERTSDGIRATLGKADPAYRDVHDAVLQAVGLGPGPEAPERALGLDALLQRAELDAQELAFDPDHLRQLLAKPKEWDSLTVAEAENVHDAVVNLRHMARDRVEVVLAGKRQTVDAWFQDLVGHLEQRKPLPQLPFSETAEGIGAKAGRLKRGADALLIDVGETYAHMLDAGDRDGPAHRLLIDGRLEARERELALTKRVLEPIREAWNRMPKDIQKLRDRRVPEMTELLPVAPKYRERIAPVYTRDNLWMLFLNWGNEGNRQRIRDGNGWSDANVEKALALLTRPELEFLDQVAQTVDGLYPEIARVYEGRTGLPLPKVESVPFEVAGQKFKGHYFPLRYDQRIARQGELQAGDAVKALFAPNYVRPATRKGHTKERLEKVNAPVDLTWGVVPSHLSQVVHDVSYGDWVRQAGGIVLDERFKALAAQYLGPERAKEFVPWLKDVANARADSSSGMMSDFQQSLGAFARNRMAVAVLGFNLPNWLQGLTDPWGAVLEGTNRRHLAAAYLKVLNPARWGEHHEFQLSKELAYRDSALTDNLRRELAAIGPTGKGVSRAIAETAFRLYDWMDRFNTRVVWKATFDQALGEGHAEVEAARRADDVVRRNFASHDLAEKPPLLRSKHGLAAVVMFYGWANRRYNQLRRRADTAQLVWQNEESTFRDRASAVADLAAKALWMGVVGAAGAYLAGRGPKEGEDATEWAAWRTLLEPLNTVPFLGPAVESLAKGQQIDARTAPELALLQDTVNRIATLARKAQDGKATDEELLWLAVEALVGVVGGPAGQVQRTGGYVRKVGTGEVQPRGPADVAGGLIYGEKRGRPRNPLTDLQDALE